MDDRKATGKTIGTVEMLTGIPKRELKYFIEQKLIQPSQRTETGYWLYSEEDIQAARLIAMCRGVGLPTASIRAVLACPVSNWREELDKHIARLEATLHLAKPLQHRDVREALRIYYDSLEQDSAATEAQ